MNEQFLRCIQYLGEENFKRLQSKKVLIAGLGGVGASTFLSLVRSGLKHFIIADFDVVELSNLNRQALYTLKDVGRKKVDVAIERARELANNLDIETIATKIDSESLKKIDGQVDIIVDAIDDMQNKIALLRYSVIKDIPIVISMGAAKRIDPTLVRVGSIEETKNDKMAKKYRELYRKSHILAPKAYAVYSLESAKEGVEGLPSLAFVPQTFGLTIGAKVIKLLIEGDNI